MEELVSRQRTRRNRHFQEKASRQLVLWAGMGELADVLMLGMTEADGFAITMLSVILLSFGTIGVLFACMVRNASRRDVEVDRLLDEMERDEKAAGQVKAGRGEEKKGEPWEKDADWWKDD